MIKPAFIDLSHHSVIPESLKPARRAGILGVIHKLTESTSFVDSKVAARRQLARDAGMLWGIYHFVRPASMDAQLEHFTDQAAALEVCDDDTLWCLDWEDDRVSADEAVYFMTRLEEMIGRGAVLYSGHILKASPDPRLQKHRLWVCHYGVEQPALPAGWETWWAWQYSDTASVAGVTPPTDVNAFNGDIVALARSWSGSGRPPEPVLPAPPELEVQVIVTTPPGVKVTLHTRTTDPETHEVT